MRTSTVTPFGVSDSTNDLYCANDFFGVISGTSRIDTFAVARAGITVFAPAPVKPPGIPCTSSVGRAHVRSSTE